MSTTAQQVKNPPATPVNYVEVIKDIEEFYSDHTVPVYCPVSAATVQFKPLSVLQLKQFIELQVSAGKDEYGVLPGLNAITALNNTILQNATEYSKDKLLSGLTVIDRDAIVLQLRCSVKAEAEVLISPESDETEIIDLKSVVSQVKGTKYPAKLKSKKKKFDFGSGSINLTMRVPTLQRDSEINDRFQKHIIPTLRKGRKFVEKNAEQVLSSVYFLELCKYIDNLVIIKGKTETTVDFGNINNFDENLLLLEKLPSKIVSEVSSFMVDVRKYRDEIFSYTNSDDKRVPLDIDIALFAGI